MVSASCWTAGGGSPTSCGAAKPRDSAVAFLRRRVGFFFVFSGIGEVYRSLSNLSPSNLPAFVDGFPGAVYFPAAFSHALPEVTHRRSGLVQLLTRAARGG